jgi:hypothetical protein
MLFFVFFLRSHALGQVSGTYVITGIDRGGFPGQDPPNHATRGGPPMDGLTQLLEKTRPLFLKTQIRLKYSLASDKLKKSSVFSSHHQLSSLCLTIHRLYYHNPLSHWEGYMSRAHSFPRKILSNSAGQFAKFCGSPRQNRPNSAAHRRLPFVSKLSSNLFRNFSYLRLALCRVTLATYKEYCQFSFQK